MYFSSSRAAAFLFSYILSTSCLEMLDSVTQLFVMLRSTVRDVAHPWCAIIRY